MNKSIYIATVAGLLFVSFFLLIDDEDVSHSSQINNSSSSTSQVSSKSNVNITFVSSSSSSKDSQKLEMKKVEEPKPQEAKKVLYSTNSENYEIKVIEKESPKSFPTIPTTFEGTINSEKFTTIIPTDRKVEMEIRDKRSGEVKIVTPPTNLEAGGKVKVDMNFENPQNYSVSNKQSSDNELPPMPPGF